MKASEIRSAAIIGAGAVGAAIASMIYDTDASLVTIAADGERAARYAASGFTVNGKRYDFAVKEPGRFDAAPDLIIVATKSYNLEEALAPAAPLVGPDTLVVSLMNGITSEEIIGSRFGHEHVLPAMILGIDAVRDRGRVDYANRGNIHFGLNPAVGSEGQKPDDHPQRAAVSAVRAFFERCSIPCTVSADIERTLWWKFMINVGINQPSAILRATYGVFQKNEEARSLMRSAMREVVELSKKADIGLSEQDIDQWDRTLSTLLPGGKTSMLQDVEAGRRTEVDLFAGAIVEMGRRYDVDVPVNTVLYRMLKTIESMREGS